jgi:DNA repair protein RadD
MIFKYLPESELQTRIGLDNISRLKKVLPKIDESFSGEQIDRLHTRKELSKIYASFVDANSFESKHFRKDLLNRLPEANLINFAQYIELEDCRDFEITRELILKQKWGDNEFSSKFLKFFELSDFFKPSKKLDLLDTEVIENTQLPFKTLKDYQSTIFFESSEKLKIKFKRFIIQMPTGSGKTRTAMEIISDRFKANPPGITIIWLAHAAELCEQASQAFTEVWTHLGNKPVKIMRVWGNYHESMELDQSVSNFVIGGFQKFHAILSKNKQLVQAGDKIDLIIIDEAHKVLAPTYKEVTEALTADYTRVIGLTATPGRGINNAEQNKALADFFHDELLTIKTKRNESVIKYLRDKKILSKAKFEALIGSTIELTQSEKERMERFFDYSPGFLKKLGNDDIRNIEIIKKLITLIDNKKRIIFFGTSIDQSKFITSVITFLGHSISHIDGGTSKAARKSLLSDFKNGNLQVISNYGVLSTGFDAPETDVVFIARPTQSIVLYSQMIGRGLRGPAIGGTPTCTIITVKDNIIGLPNEENIFEYFDEYFDS